jgi:flagellar biogenesis protein FliO
MNSLFGVDMPTPVNFVIAFVVVLLLIGAATWVVRRFGATGLDAASRGRQPRLAVIDAAAVDSRRKLVIIRRDNVEHLLMIGGPTDVVVETNIVRMATATAREAPAARANGGADALRAVPSPDTAPWPSQPDAPIQPARGERAPRIVVDDPPRWDAPSETPAPPLVRTGTRSAESLAGLASDLSKPTEPVAKPRVVASEPAAAAQAAAAAASAAQAQATPVGDHSLAEMAQRLEAALRRPASTQRVAADGGARTTVTAAADPKPATTLRESKITMIQPKSSAQPKPQPAPQPSADLEQEMATLLSRPGKT